MHGKKAETMREQHQAVNGLRRWCGQRGLDLVTEFRELDGPSWDTCICDGIKRCGGDGEEDYDELCLSWPADHLRPPTGPEEMRCQLGFVEFLRTVGITHIVKADGTKLAIDLSGLAKLAEPVKMSAMEF